MKKKNSLILSAHHFVCPVLDHQLARVAALSLQSSEIPYVSPCVLPEVDMGDRHSIYTYGRCSISGPESHTQQWEVEYPGKTSHPGVTNHGPDPSSLGQMFHTISSALRFCGACCALDAVQHRVLTFGIYRVPSVYHDWPHKTPYHSLQQSVHHLQRGQLQQTPLVSCNLQDQSLRVPRSCLMPSDLTCICLQTSSDVTQAYSEKARSPIGLSMGTAAVGSIQVNEAPPTGPGSCGICSSLRSLPGFPSPLSCLLDLLGSIPI